MASSRSRVRVRASIAALAVGIGVAMLAYDAVTTSDFTNPLGQQPPTPSPPIDADRARTQLEGLTVRDDAWRSDYERAAFGDGWADLDGNGCHTRDEILRGTLTDTVMLDDCRVQRGTLDVDPYTATAVTFTRGGDSEIDIDHVVALADAWNSGAWAWSDSERLAFANDPTNLLAVDAATNRAKGAATAADWLPANSDFACQYVAMQVSVKHAYGLSVAGEEAQTIHAVLDGC